MHTSFFAKMKYVLNIYLLNIYLLNSSLIIICKQFHNMLFGNIIYVSLIM